MKNIYDKSELIANIVLQFSYLGKNYLDEKAESSCLTFGRLQLPS